jgi:hypothetical protein
MPFPALRGASRGLFRPFPASSSPILTR